MTNNKNLGLGNHLHQYLLSVSLREAKVLTQLRQETAELPGARMQIAPEQGQFMTLLVQLLGAKKALEIGVFTGYSSLCIAFGLPTDGKLVACDVNEESTAIAHRYWRKAGISNKIDLHLAPAFETLQQLLNSGEAKSFDFVFIDADKRNYDTYYEKSLQLLRSGGIIIVDNVLWGGKVADPEIQDPQTIAIRNFNEKLHRDTRVNISMLAIADGLTLARKK